MPQVRDCEHSDAFSQLEANVRWVAEQSTNVDAQSAQQLKISENSRRHLQESRRISKETPRAFSCNATTGACDSEGTQNRRCPSCERRREAPQEQHEDCMTKYNEIQMDKKLRQHSCKTENKKQNVFDSESRRDLNFTVQPKEERRSIVT